MDINELKKIVKDESQIVIGDKIEKKYLSDS